MLKFNGYNSQWEVASKDYVRETNKDDDDEFNYCDHIRTELRI